MIGDLEAGCCEKSHSHPAIPTDEGIVNTPILLLHRPHPLMQEALPLLPSLVCSGVSARTAILNPPSSLQATFLFLQSDNASAMHVLQQHKEAAEIVSIADFFYAPPSPVLLPHSLTRTCPSSTTLH